jgi:hypothetical protein
VQAGAVDHVGRADIAGGGLDQPFGAVAAQRQHAGAVADLTAALAHDAGVAFGDTDVVDDAGRRHGQRLQAGRVRLDLAQPLGADHVQAGHAIGDTAPAELGEPRQLVGQAATTTLPQISWAMPFACANATIRVPCTVKRAFSDPGL